MASLTIAGIPPLDGDYDLDIGAFTNRELHTIKQISGIRAGELGEAMAAADNDLIVAFAVIVLRRAGKTVDPDQIWDADLGAITVSVGEEAAEERPPTSLSPDGNASSSGGSESQSDSTAPSGLRSVATGDPRASDPRGTGVPGSDTSAVSDLAISAS